MERIIVSRHPAAAVFIAEQITNSVTEIKSWMVSGSSILFFPDGEGPEYEGQQVCQPAPCLIVPILSSAIANDLQGKHVYGDIPLHLAACAQRVTKIEFKGIPPHGEEYTLEDIKRSGAYLATYEVRFTPQSEEEINSWYSQP